MYLHGGVDNRGLVVSSVLCISRLSSIYQIKNLTAQFSGDILPYKSSHISAIIYHNEDAFVFYYGGTSLKVSFSADLFAINLNSYSVKSLWSTNFLNETVSWGGLPSIGSCMVSLQDKLVIFGGKRFLRNFGVVSFSVW